MSTNNNNNNVKYLFDKIYADAKNHRNYGDASLVFDHYGPNGINYVLCIHNKGLFYPIIIYATEICGAIVAVNLRNKSFSSKNYWEIDNQTDSVNRIINKVIEQLDTPNISITLDDDMKRETDLIQKEFKELSAFFDSSDRNDKFKVKLINFEVTNSNIKKMRFTFNSPIINSKDLNETNKIKITLSYQDLDDLIKSIKLFLNNIELFTFHKLTTSLHISNSFNPFKSYDDKDNTDNNENTDDNENMTNCEYEWFLLSYKNCKYSMIKIYVAEEKLFFTHVLSPNHDRIIPFKMSEHFIFELEHLFPEKIDLYMESQDEPQILAAEDYDITLVSVNGKNLLKINSVKFKEQIKVLFKSFSNVLQEIKIDFGYTDATNIARVINFNSLCFVKEDLDQNLWYLLSLIREFKEIAIPKYAKDDDEARDLEYD